MSLYLRDFDINYIYDLLKFAEIAAVTPPLNRKKQELTNFKYYHIIVIVLTIIFAAYSSYGIIVYFIPRFNGTSTTLRLICVIIIALLNILSVLVAACNVHTWNMFLKVFKHLDQKLKYQSQKENNILKVELSMYYLVLFTIFGYDAYIWYSNYHWDLFKFVLFKYVSFIHANVMMLVILHFASALSNRYKKINNLLIKSNDFHNIFNSLIGKGSKDKLNNLKSIKEVTDYYLLLSDLVEMFNKLFGWQIFIVTEYILLFFLEFSNGLMLSLDPAQKSGVYHDLRTVLSLVLFSLLTICYQAMIILYCENVNKESRNTLSICYKLQETVDPMSEERKELAILSDVVNFMKTKINASGFYTIDRSLLGRFFAYMFSYSIVLLQFNRQTTIRETKINNSFYNATLTCN
ncbi:gustatory and pheromone receptor 39a-like [Diabrotica virgifera virgifera]|uniref:Gustatory receptor n=1 Tax=Diabrotica virgifera virgifera TaxID=50390 RepID=A0A6P7F4X9_DIAVI|nr:gustatory and pheromone receptor 39a-like [Diabrotica virgifera virgifera]